MISSLNSVCWVLWPSHVTATVVACDLPCTFASVIFRTSSHSDFTLCFFDLSIKILALLLWTTLTIGKHLFQLFPKSLVNPSLHSLDSCCLLSVALQSSPCHLVSTSLPAVGTALLPAVGTALSSRILGFRPWLIFFVLHVRLIRVLLLTSWLTHALSLFLPSPAAIGLLFLAPSTHCRLLLLCRFLVSARACLSRSFVSSRLTATFFSSSSLSRHFRVRLLVWSASPAPSCGSLQRRGCRSSLQHCCVVLSYGVVAGPAAVR